jgi:transcriptional regulator with XRE-family HTH domain
MKAIYVEREQSYVLPTGCRQQGNTDDGFMTMFGDILRQLRTEQGISLGQFALRVHYNKGYLSRIENGQKAPSEELARMCDAALGARGNLIAAAHLDIAAMRDTKPSYTSELLSRIQASDMTSGAVESMHATVIDLCCQYAHRDARELRSEAHDWLREIGRMLRQPIGLRQHQEALVAAGWLALLIGCTEYDLGMRAAAEATRMTASQLGQEAGSTAIVGWSYEMSAWFALTQGRYANVLDATEAGRAVAGNDSVAVQLIGQEAKALGRMGNIAGLRDALDRGRRQLASVEPPTRLENHFSVDPAKWDFYAMDAFRLAGDNDQAAEHAQEVLRSGTAPDGTERAPMRMAEARLTLAVGEARRGNLDNAMGIGLAALKASRKSLPSLLMVAGELDAALQQRWPAESSVEDFREAVRSVG